MKLFKVCAALLILFALTVACGPTPQAAASKDDALRMADSYVATHFPRPKLDLYTRQVADRGHSWVIVYQLPDTYAGGGRTVEIDKASGSVVRAFATQ